MSLALLLEQVRGCAACAAQLPLGPRPVVQAGARARILIAGQAPGRKVHHSGVPFDDASGERLRQWMGISALDFHDEERVAIVPMGFCYPGSGRSGDLAPLAECARRWRPGLLQQLPNIELTLLIGRYAQDWHLGAGLAVTERVMAWRTHMPSVLPLPHPSPRNNLWLKKNGWFTAEVVPELQQRVRALLAGSAN
jgi:uracil-DNA glycosylase